jgi:choice-of-anchor C domain-containing protein
MTTKLACIAIALGLGTALAHENSGKDQDPEKSNEVNLLVNGSFEEGPELAFGGRLLHLNEGSQDIKGWTVTRGQITYQGTSWQHADGKRSLDLHGGPGIGGIKQTFATKKGQKYRVLFALAGNPEGKVSEKILGVAAAGKEERFKFDTKGKTRQDMGWSTQAWEFVADAKETTLELYSLMTEDDSWGPALDNVSVVEVKD